MNFVEMHQKFKKIIIYSFPKAVRSAMKCHFVIKMHRIILCTLSKCTNKVKIKFVSKNVIFGILSQCRRVDDKNPLVSFFLIYRTLKVRKLCAFTEKNVKKLHVLNFLWKI